VATHERKSVPVGCGAVATNLIMYETAGPVIPVSGFLTYGPPGAHTVPLFASARSDLPIFDDMALISLKPGTIMGSQMAWPVLLRLQAPGGL
jgi:hypothetical protein